MWGTLGRWRPKRSFRSTARAGVPSARGRICSCFSTISCRRYSENRYLVDEPPATQSRERVMTTAAGIATIALVTASCLLMAQSDRLHDVDRMVAFGRSGHAWACGFDRLGRG